MSDILLTKDPMDGWIIVLNGGHWFIGKRAKATSPVLGLHGEKIGTRDDHSRIKLDPCYELIHVRGIIGNGDVQYQHTVAPVLCLHGFSWMEFPDSPVLELSATTPNVRQFLHIAIKRAEAMADQIRAKAMGMDVPMPPRGPFR